MSSRFICNYPENEKERISTQLFDFFCAELIYARSSSNHELWIISPWITENFFDISNRGSYEDFWPGVTDSQISFSDVIKKFLDYGSKVKIVCKPPHRLIDLECFYRYIRIQNKSKEIEAIFDDLIKFLSTIPQVVDSRGNSSSINVLTELKKEIKENFKANSERELNRSTDHLDVISIVQDIKCYAPDMVQLYYNSKLHSKIILGKLGALFGSSNITYSGLNSNDELMYYTTDEDIINNLNLIAKNLTEGESWKTNSNDYSILAVSQRKIDNYKLNKILEADLPISMKNTLEMIGFQTDLYTKNELMDSDNELKSFDKFQSLSSLPESNSLTSKSIPMESISKSEHIYEEMTKISQGEQISLETWSKIREWDEKENKLNDWCKRFVLNMVNKGEKSEPYSTEKQASYAREVYAQAKRFGYK